MKTKRHRLSKKAANSAKVRPPVRARARSDSSIELVAVLQDRHRELWGHCMPTSPVELYRVLRALTKNRIKFVLTGAHGIAQWIFEPRNAFDVDILVPTGRPMDKALATLKGLYPKLVVQRSLEKTSLLVKGQTISALDIVCPFRPDLEATLANPTWVFNQDENVEYRIPSLEEAVANKYGAMVSATRKFEKRLMDSVDFFDLVSTSTIPGRAPIKLRRLKTLGEKVWPNGGGAEILRLVKMVKAGEQIVLAGLGLNGCKLTLGTTAIPTAESLAHAIPECF